MEILEPTDTGIAKAVDLLQQGKVIAHATETCYGLACDLSNPDSVRALFEAKKRPLDQPVSALFASVDQAKEYVEWNEQAEEYADQLPGPLTLILPLRDDAPHQLHLVAEGHCPNVGVRVSPHPIALALAEAFGSPISTTSANLSGAPNPYARDEISASADAVIDSGTIPQNPPSRVIDLTGNLAEIRR